MRAGEQGHVIAQYNLGILYASGRGVPQDWAQAFKWYRQAAEQGYALAQSSLAVLYVEGNGTPRDAIRALMWLNLAAGRGDARAVSTRDRLLKEMTAAQIAEAQKMSAGRKPLTSR